MLKSLPEQGNVLQSFRAHNKYKVKTYAQRLKHYDMYGHNKLKEKGLFFNGRSKSLRTIHNIQIAEAQKNILKGSKK